MKNICLSATFICFSYTSSFSQQYQQQQQRTLKEYTITERTIKLNGDIRATFGRSLGATSRTSIPIVLPPNTVEWYYSFTTSRNGSSVPSIKLALQIGGLLSNFYIPGSGVAFGGLAGAADKINIPPGAMPINAFVMDTYNSNIFVNTNNQATYFPNIQAENSTEGKVLVSNLRQGTYNLCIQNISNTNAIIVRVEVVAIVLETKVMESSNNNNSEINNGWPVEFKQKMYNRWLSVAKKTENISDNDANMIARCTQQKIITSKSYSEYIKMRQDDWEQNVKKLYQECYNAIMYK